MSSFRYWIIEVYVFTNKDSTILVNLHQLHYDPEIWGDPHNFRPERFISADRKVIRHEAYMPFGVGEHYIGPTYFQIITE
jgi:cytochrome P450